MENLLPYTADEFFAAVQTGDPRTAIFDCDGTLWSEDSGFGFMLWSLTGGLVSPQMKGWMEDQYGRYEAGQIDEATICGEMVQVYQGLRQEALVEAARSFAELAIRPCLFAEMAELAANLHAGGVELWAVSSTSRWVVEAGLATVAAAPLIPRHRVLAAEVEIVDGIATDRLLAVPTDEAKAEALRREGLPAPDLVFGNSVHDAAMLSLARQAFPVNPSPALADLAQQKGWRVFHPAAPADLKERSFSAQAAG